MEFFSKLGGFLFSPSYTFHETKDESLFEALKFFFLLVVINSVLNAVASIFFVSGFGLMMGQVISYDMLGGNEYIFLSIISSIVVLIVGALIMGCLYHIFIAMVGGQNGVGQTIKGILYAQTPALLIGWIPIIGIIAAIWSFFLILIGISEYQNISVGEVLKAQIYFFITVAFLWFVLASTVLISILGRMGGSPYIMMP